VLIGVYRNVNIGTYVTRFPVKRLAKTGQYVPDFQGQCEQKRKKPRDGLSVPAGMQRPRDASSKGCIIQGMHNPRDASSRDASSRDA
jgi:hypothetical protein